MRPSARPHAAPAGQGASYEPAAFDDLPGWAGDDHLAAFSAFLNSWRPDLIARAEAVNDTALAALASRAVAAAAGIRNAHDARRFFETEFQPFRLRHAGPRGQVTGYYEPVLAGARTPGGPYAIPLYRRPADLVNLVEEAERGAVGLALTHARRTVDGLMPYATRAEIEQGALAGLGLELAYLADPVDAFLLQVQGSGVISLPDGTHMRVSYDGKNGHPYTSIGRHLIETGAIPAAEMSLQSLADWLRADGARGREVMWRNASFVFFRELEGAQALAPLGVLDVPLSNGRSLAVDTAWHALGTPIYVTAPTLRPAGEPDGFRRLMIAQDVGSAIRGPERGDLFFGSGEAAGRLAGNVNHAATFFILHATGAPPPLLRDAP